MRAAFRRSRRMLVQGFVVAPLLSLGGCGFQLRGTADLPFESLWIDIPDSNPLGAELKRTLRTGTRTRVTSRREDAEAVMLPTREARGRTILSLSSSGRVREFRLSYAFEFRIADARGRDLVEPIRLQLERDFPFNDSQVLAKETEEALLYREMQSDMVQQVLRRLSTAQRLPAKG